MGPFISNSSISPTPSSKSGLINQLVESFENKKNLQVQTITLPTLRIIEKVAKEEIKNWITFSTDGSVTLIGLEEAPVEAISKSAIAIPIAGFEIKLWTNKKFRNRYSSLNSIENKTVLITRNFHYTGFTKLQKELKFNKKSAPSLFSAVKMLISERTDFIIASAPTVFWNLDNLSLTESDLYPLELPEHLRLFSNIFIMLDHKLPKTFIDNFTNHIKIMENNGKLQKIRTKLNLQKPRVLTP
ncbi:hypothetical protein [Maricurvus nonylphenolicus]|uniref:hypothetical protein n=1 Tax=Maricurvus nonylphenolicus TaxID=1008307 RepID=UPI0036F20086